MNSVWFSSAVVAVGAVSSTIACGPLSPLGGAGGTGGSAGADSGTPACVDYLPARLCVLGRPSSTGEPFTTLNVGDPLKIAVSPDACLSSSCTIREIATCSVTGEGPFAADATFCLGTRSQPACTPDCNGGGSAFCESAALLTAGEQTITLGTLKLTFTVPSQIPSSALCVGSLP